VGILVPRLRFHRRLKTNVFGVSECAAFVSVKERSFADGEIIVANLELSNDNC
jgi:hypothetical protein